MNFRKIYGKFWSDPRVVEEMDLEDKLFYLYIISNPCTTSCGIYMITKKQMAFEVGYPIKTINSLMDKFENQFELIKYNPETRELAVKNWGKYNLNRGGKPVVDCLISELSRVKDKSLISYVLGNIQTKAIKDIFESFCDTLPEGERIAVREGDKKERYINIDKDIDKDIEKETEKDRVPEIDKNTEMETGAEEKTVIEDAKAQEETLSLIENYEKITCKVGILNFAAVKLAVIQHGHNNVQKAIDKALEKGKLSMSYINGILRTWAVEGYPKKGESRINGSYYKDNGAAPGEFSGFKPQEPKQLTEDERKALEESLL